MKFLWTVAVCCSVVLQLMHIVWPLGQHGILRRYQSALSILRYHLAVRLSDTASRSPPHCPLLRCFDLIYKSLLDLRRFKQVWKLLVVHLAPLFWLESMNYDSIALTIGKR